MILTMSAFRQAKVTLTQWVKGGSILTLIWMASSLAKYSCWQLNKK